MKNSEGLPEFLPSPEEMRVWDQDTSAQFGLPGTMLMENASRAMLDPLVHAFGPLQGRTALVVAGPGNNGGDALAFARHLYEHGMQVCLLHTRALEDYRGDAAFHAALVQKLPLSTCLYDAGKLSQLESADLLVDGLLGTGVQGDMRPEFRALCTRLQELFEDRFILAVDIPSGLSGQSGQPMPVALKATLTVTFEAAKRGLFLPEARGYCGQLVVRSIGIPRAVKKARPAACAALTDEILGRLEPPLLDMHKGSSGHVLILGGSEGLCGAPVLAACGAYRAGAGLVTLASPEGLLSQMPRFPEIMTLGLGAGRTWHGRCAAFLRERWASFAAVVLGPGLGRDQGARDFLEAYLENPHPCTVFDADALFWLAEDKKLQARLPATGILTPHPGEMARFFACTAAELAEDREGFARTLMNALPGVLVLKGAGTLVTDQKGPCWIAPFCVPNLAVGGSGDVLAGMLGALLAQGYTSLTAARIAVYWHGLAGWILAKDFPCRGNTPMEIADAVPAAYKEWKNAYRQRYYDSFRYFHSP